MALASRSDVAGALGLSDVDDLTDAQKARVDGLLERVSGMVEREAQRNFTPGPVESQMIVTDGRIYLQQVVSVESVVDHLCGRVVDFDLTGDWLTVTVDGWRVASGTRLMVSYTRGPVPDAVVAFTAGVVARHLTVEPGSPESMATDITAGADYRLRMADHVSSTSLLTEDECAEARGFRSKLPSTIIHRL